MSDPSPFWKRIISVLVGCFVINFSIWLAALGGREALGRWLERSNPDE